MKPIKLYFAGAWGGGGKSEAAVRDCGVKNKLVSYVYPSQLSGWFEVTKNTPGNIMVDSGAFSAWNKGKEIDLGAYIEYAHEAIRKGEELNKKVYIVNLDVIPGQVGQTRGLIKNRKKDNRDLIEQAAKQGYKNMHTMLRNGITPIHVFHQGEDWKWLDRMLGHTNYIGISPANDLGVSVKKRWIESVFEYLYKKNADVDTHGFAVWMVSVLRKFPWTSCDAATWRLLAAWGGIMYPRGGFSSPDYSKPPLTLAVSEKRNCKGVGLLTPQLIKMLAEDGYSYEELQHWSQRAALNIRYFLELEKWLNKEKTQKEFKPKNLHLGVC